MTWPTEFKIACAAAGLAVVLAACDTAGSSPSSLNPLGLVPSGLRAAYPDDASCRKIGSGFADMYNINNRYRRSLGIHKGVDIRAPVRTPVLAAADGFVAYASLRSLDLKEVGSRVSINHFKTNTGLSIDTTTVYLHLLPNLEVKRFSRVEKGDVIGYVGPHSAGSHLHFAVLSRGKWTDPLSWYSEIDINSLLENKVRIPYSVAGSFSPFGTQAIWPIACR